MPEPVPPLPRDGIYRSILMVLAASVVVGAAVTLAGDLIYEDPAITRAGTGLGLLSGVLYIFFRFLGRRQALREAARRVAGTEGEARDD